MKKSESKYLEGGHIVSPSGCPPNYLKVEDSDGSLVGEFFVEGPLGNPQHYIVSSRLVDSDKKSIDVVHTRQEAQRKMSDHMILHISSLERLAQSS
jgi:hypothetical protein